MRSFFGLGDSYFRGVIDSLFDLKMYGGFSIYESYNLPVGLRRYYIEKLVKKLEQEKEAMEKSKKTK